MHERHQWIQTAARRSVDELDPRAQVAYAEECRLALVEERLATQPDAKVTHCIDANDFDVLVGDSQRRAAYFAPLVAVVARCRAPYFGETVTESGGELLFAEVARRIHGGEEAKVIVRFEAAREFTRVLGKEKRLLLLENTVESLEDRVVRQRYLVDHEIVARLESDDERTVFPLEELLALNFA